MWTYAAFGDHINFATEEFRQILFESNLIEEAAAGFERYEHIQVAARLGVPTCNRTKNSYSADTVSRRDSENLIALIANLMKEDHFVRASNE
jgi:hypothetical protein